MALLAWGWPKALGAAHAPQEPVLAIALLPPPRPGGAGLCGASAGGCFAVVTASGVQVWAAGQVRVRACARGRDVT